MRKISPKVKREVEKRPDVCVRKDEGCCSGVITWEHVFIYAGKQVDSAWNILKVCEYHHSVGKHLEDGDLDKDKHQWLALNQATEEELDRDMPKYPWRQRLDYLDTVYNS